jgi:PadR family transcriptional regulator, regulatory protein PadR
MLEAMEKRGYLVSRRERIGRSIRRLYSATPLGREALALAKARLRGLFREVVEEDVPHPHP